VVVWLKAMLVAMGGACGALSRWGVGELALKLGWGAPIGTLMANMAGCLLIGMAKAAVDATGWGSPELRVFVFTGFLGAFTTFSTFEADSFGLWKVGERGWAVAYLFGSVGGGLAMFLLGWFVIHRLVQ
jgi:CrcB protein